LLAVPVKAPGFAERRKAMLDDIAVVTGGIVASRDSGLSIAGLSLLQLGKAKRITVTKDSTYISDGAGSQEALNARVQAVRNQIERERSDMEREKLQERLAKRSGAVSVIMIGSDGDSETRLHRAINAMFVSRAAVEAGSVPGGGSALWHARDALLVDEADAGKRAGMEVIWSGLTVPLELQVENARADIREVRAGLTSDKSISAGFNAVTRRVEDMYHSGVIDPTDVIVNALRAAFAQGRAVLQTGAWGEEEGGEAAGTAVVPTS